MNRIVVALLLFGSTSPAWATQQLFPNDPIPTPQIPVIRLISSSCPKDPIWIKVTIVEVIDNDTFIVEDPTGRILLFIPSDEVIATSFDLGPGKTIFANGSVDISPVKPSKNEFYAEKILFAPQPNPAGDGKSLRKNTQ